MPPKTFIVEVADQSCMHHVEIEAHGGDMTTHTRFATPIVTAILLFPGCDDLPASGTQVGSEDSAPWCEERSVEVLADLDAVPAEMSLAPRGVIDNLVGSFSGFQFDEFEQLTDDEIRLQVADLAGDVTLTLFDPVDEGTNDGAGLCPGNYTFDLDVVVETDGLPTFTNTMEIRVTDPSDGWSRHRGQTGFDGDLPAPTTFDADDVDVLEPEVGLSTYTDNWTVHLSWYAERHDGLGEDGGHSILNESLAWATLERD